VYPISKHLRLCYNRITYFVYKIDLILKFIIFNILARLSFDIQRLKLKLELIFDNLINIFIGKVTTSLNNLRLINLLFQNFCSYSVPIGTSIWWILLVRWINRCQYIFISIVIHLLIALFFIILNTVIMIQINLIFKLVPILLMIMDLLLILFQSISYHWYCFVSEWIVLLL